MFLLCPQDTPAQAAGGVDAQKPLEAGAEAGNLVRLICDGIWLTPQFEPIQGYFAVSVTPQRTGGKVTVELDFARHTWNGEPMSSMEADDISYRWGNAFTWESLGRRFETVTAWSVDRYTGRYDITMTATQTWDVSDSAWLVEKMGASSGIESGHGRVQGFCERAPEQPRM